MSIATNYTWEAEKADGQIITEGGDLTGCARFSLIPTVPGLPQHDLTGVPMVRRFARSINKIALGDSQSLPGLLSWENGSNIVGTTEDLTGILAPLSAIRKRHDGEKWWIVRGVASDHVTIYGPYDGRTKKIESKKLIPPPASEYLHCIVCEGFRVWVKSSNGTVLITSEDYELYL